ncbi:MULTISPECIES: hypothetical protein [Zoogloea]|jgi:hypothetical protein|uniref:Uncharacterized protein n=1 Tax=Zoogloea oleivorans TaxID=1552750 RepID=A0A6C2C9J4_9RHOO|nr:MULTISPECIES: hypothetical protein [Zoogloea]MBT9498377.1 hypothetical protein [Zoogloea sp.]MDD2668666.1 hypothetical protein [Zoogloea sp.]MDY0037033.1 hypothetical protein [Zoogloea oleivorans]TYC50269.1 hypothetical protein ETQ85_25325 [Zoogloea oleivorans]
MARFAVGQAIPGVEPVIVVDAGLPVGGHRFQLVVVDSAGRRSAPVEAVVTVSRVLTPIPDRPEIILTGTTTPVVLRPGRTPRKTKRSKPT